METRWDGNSCITTYTDEEMQELEKEKKAMLERVELMKQYEEMQKRCERMRKEENARRIIERAEEIKTRSNNPYINEAMALNVAAREQEDSNRMSRISFKINEALNEW